jgi:2-octaprenyl-6-methoxyphenol hydroxylase
MSAADRVATLGGGPIGLACALLLADKGIASVVIDARSLAEAANDARLLALSRGSWDTLRALLPRLPRHAAIRDVFVSSAGEFGSTHLASSECGGADLGATVLYRDLLEALAQAASMQPLIDVRRPCRALRIEQMPDRVRLVLQDADAIEAALAVRAEGLMPDDRAPASATEQWALVADVRMRGPAAASAFERFAREGPLALLPTPTQLGDNTARTLALVWCMPGLQAERRLQLADAACLAELRQVVGAIGIPEAIGPRSRFALVQQRRARTTEHRVVTLGNAAQTLHPVAGQGFNLGLRDCIALADSVAAAKDVATALASYAARRRIDRIAISELTRWLPEVFATRFTPAAIARGAGLLALDQSRVLRHALANILMFGIRA